MKKLILFVFCILNLALPVFSQEVKDCDKPFECEISFDWITKTQIQRDENIKQIQDILFTNDVVVKYKRSDFKKKYSAFWKNPNYFNDYEAISKGKTEDSDKNYCGFYFGKLLVAYGIQYKNNLKNKYYYDAMGRLRWVDVLSDNYPEFPYWSYQYYKDGKLVAAYYNISEYDQYIFDTNKKFIGRAYKEKIYNKNAKVIMTRTDFWNK